MKKLWEKYGSQFIRFGCVGAVNTLVDMLVYWLTLLLLGNGAPLGEHNYLLAQLLGFVAGTLNAYFMNGKFVFAGADGKRKKDLKRLVRTAVGAAFVGMDRLRGHTEAAGQAHQPVRHRAAQFHHQPILDVSGDRIDLQGGTYAARTKTETATGTEYRKGGRGKERRR